jgi:hypothetical protein
MQLAPHAFDIFADVANFIVVLHQSNSVGLQ